MTTLNETAVDWMMYKSYEYNRLRDLDRPAESWKKLYRDADEYEKILTEKLKKITLKGGLK